MQVKSIDEILAHMSLRDRIGQMMCVSFRIWADEEKSTENTAENAEKEDKEINITELNDELRGFLKEYHPGAAIFFSENLNDPEQTLRLTADMQTAMAESGGVPLIISTDQEGGFISRVSYGTSGPGSMAIAATGNPENAKRMGAIYGEELSLLGINTDYAPVMDINNNYMNPVIGIRSFSDDPETVSAYGLAFMEGLRESGTIVTLKHFPGHGSTDTDSHTGFPKIENSYEELKQFELIPFQKAFDAGADMIMTAHIQYPNIEKETYTSASTGEQVYLPATMSRTILTDILRGDMGYEGIVVTDALGMAAVADNFAKEDTITLAVSAGADVLLLPVVMNKKIFYEDKEMIDTALKLTEEGKIPPERIDESVRRILTLKEKHGLLSVDDYEVTDEQIGAAVSGVGSTENREAAWRIAGEALTLLKNENSAFPISLRSGETTLILFSNSAASRVGAGELAKKLLEEENLIPEGAEINVLVSTKDNEEECVRAALEADHLVLVHRMNTAADIDAAIGSGFSAAVFDRIISERHAAGGQAVLISCHLPYDAVRFPDADAILLTYGASLMEEVPPETGRGSACMPNLPAGLLACFGKGEIKGQLPVKLPEEIEK